MDKASARDSAAERALVDSAASQVALIVNPVAGRGRAARLLGGIVRRLERSFPRVLCHVTRAPGAAAVFAAEVRGDVGAVFVMGGDGTLNEVLAALGAAGPPLGILPTGTGNVLAKEHGIPSHPERALELLLAGRVIQVDLGLLRIGGVARPFATMVSAGFDARVVEWIARHRDGPMTMARYVPAIASVMGRTFGPLEVTADGEVVSRAAEYVLVANTSAYGGPFTMVPQADSTDGWLDLLTYEGPVLRRFPSLLIHGMRGTLGKVPGMRLRRVRSVAVAAPHAVPVQCDGEFLGHTPVEATVQPAALRLLVPASERHSQ